MEHPTHSVFGEGLKKKFIDLALAAGLGFITALGASWWSLNDIRHEIDRLADKERTRSEIEKQKANDELRDAEARGQTVERLNNLIEQQKRLQDEMRDAQRRR